MKLNRKNSLVFAIIFMVAGIISLIFYKANTFSRFLSCVFFGVGFILLGKTAKFQYQHNLIKLDKESKKMLKDIEENGEESQYNNMIDKDHVYSNIMGFIKKNKRAHIIFYICGGLLILFSLIALI